MGTAVLLKPRLQSPSSPNNREHNYYESSILFILIFIFILNPKYVYLSICLCAVMWVLRTNNLWHAEEQLVLFTAESVIGLSACMRCCGDGIQCTHAIICIRYRSSTQLYNLSLTESLAEQ